MLENRFYIPKFYTIATVLLGLVFIGLGLWGVLDTIHQCLIEFPNSINPLISPLILLIFYCSMGSVWIGFKYMNRFRYSSIKIVLDDVNQLMVYENKKKTSVVKYKDILEVHDLVGKHILQLKAKTETVIIPKEISNYLSLFFRLKDNGVLPLDLNLQGLTTRIGLIQKIQVFILFPLCLTIFYLFIVDEPLNVLDIIKYGLGGIVLVILLFISLHQYKFTANGIEVSNLIYNRHIAYSNIKSLDLDKHRKRIVLTLVNDPLKGLRKFGGEEGVVIREPGNISLECLYVELNKKIRQ